MTRLHLRIQGIVQGVGFRPFVCRVARGLGLSGFVENTTRGVEIEVQGEPSAVETFVRTVRECPPPMARIFSLDASEVPLLDQGRLFEIRASRVDPVAAAVIPPDIATCPDCLAELTDPADRRFDYPFLNCTNCGPRYSIIQSLPYDRPRTSLSGFELCPDCAREYGDPNDRRFHAQPMACPVCGPTLLAFDGKGMPMGGNPLPEAVAVLLRGGIVALMGLGGFHLACDATNESAVAKLRLRKARPAKPFAVMVPTVQAARALVFLDEEAEALLESPRAPIVLAPARATDTVAPSVAPGQDRLGLFLPYTPLHHLLFRHGVFQALVMTSGNRSDEPIIASSEEALTKLRGVADLLLVHNRPILHRVDDSVIKPNASGPVVLRRARGFAPTPVPLSNPSGRTVLAVGAELANAVAVVRGDYAYLSPHFGDLKNLEVEEVFREGIDHLMELLRVTPDLVVCDLHPDYRSTRYAEEWEARGVEVVRVQHHEAHGAACMAENRFDGPGVVLALDGFGFGGDGTVWGGEILAGWPGAFRRAGRLTLVPQPGGDRAAREPWRMAASHLRKLVGSSWKDLPLPAFRGEPTENLYILDAMMANGVQSPLTSSCGRLFDAAAAILGFSGPLLYSAQAAMELEALAGAAPTSYSYDCGEPTAAAGTVILDPAPLLRALLENTLRGRERSECARAFHSGLAELWALGAASVSREESCKDIFLTGGCMQNAVFLESLSRKLASKGLTPHFHREIPPNDGGICFGQAAWALAPQAKNQR